jgi:hypothetical protein
MKNFKYRALLLAGVAVFGFSSLAMASPLGIASITNCDGGGATVTATTITWAPTAGPGLGCISLGLPTSISYSGGTLNSPGTGTIEDLPAGPPPFITLAGGVLAFGLTAFQTPVSTDGICSTSTALSAGHSCVVSVDSPFLLVSNGATTTVNLVALGIVTDTGDSSTAPYRATFSTNSNNDTAFIANEIDTGGAATNTYSATLIVGTPEPATVSMFLLAGIGLIGIGRKKFVKR